MDTKFQSRFIFQPLAGTMFLNKSLCLFYSEGHRGKVPMDDVGGTIKNVICGKVKSGQIVVHTPKEFSDAAIKFVPSIITVYLPKSDEILILKASIRHHSSPKHFQSTNLFDRSMTEEIAVQSFSRRRQTRKPFTLSGTKKLMMLFVVTRSPIKAIASVQCAGNGIQKTGVNGYNVAFINSGFAKHVLTFKSNF